MKKMIAVILSIISINCFADTQFSTGGNCPNKAKIGTETFCDDFKADTICHCIQQHLGSTCDRPDVMQVMYNLMVQTFGSVERACAMQHEVDPTTCLKDWSSYRKSCNGGKTTHY